MRRLLAMLGLIRPCGTIEIVLPKSDGEGCIKLSGPYFIGTATLDFANRTYTLEPSSSVGGAGTVQFGTTGFFGGSGGTTNVEGALSVGASQTRTIPCSIPATR